jgi:ABC-type sugar transport system ATPase subunit
LQCRFADGQIVALPGETIQSGPATLGVRPEHLILDPVDGAAFAGTITHVEYLGDEVLVHLELSLGATLTLKRPADTGLRVGASVRVGVPRARCHLFDAHGMRVG